MASGYDQVKDGEVITFEEGEIVRVACCDCGLVHDFILVRRAGKAGRPKRASIRVQVNRRATGQVRRRMRERGSDAD